LVDNPMNRYVLRPDGPVTITCSHDRPADSTWWLPAPDGRFRLGLRVFYPLEPIITGRWTPPAVVPA